jgi:hypothetical protein
MSQPDLLRGWHACARGRLTALILITAAALVPVRAQGADSNSIGVTITSDRDPDKFANPKNMKYELNGTHTFDSGLIAGASFQYNQAAFSDRVRENLEGTLGYRVRLNSSLSATGSAGVGEHWRQNPTAAFPYYVLRIAADLDLDQTVTWNVISFRYRDAFNPNENYNTPQIATGLTLKIDEKSSISAKVMRNWRDTAPSSTGVSLGWRQRF